MAQDVGPTSRFWFADGLLYLLMIVGLLVNHGRGFLLCLPRRTAPLAFIMLSWSFGMTFEASLTVDETGFGGIHRDTLSSYILAQGDYMMITVVTWVVIRQFHPGFAGAFYFAGGKNLTEGLIFTGVLTGFLLSAKANMAPPVLAYYTLAYPTFVAMPLLILDPATLWSGIPPRCRPGIRCFGF